MLFEEVQSTIRGVGCSWSFFLIFNKSLLKLKYAIFNFVPFEKEHSLKYQNESAQRIRIEQACK